MKTLQKEISTINLLFIKEIHLQFLNLKFVKIIIFQTCSQIFLS